MEKLNKSCASFRRLLERKGIEDTAIDDDFEIALEEAAREDRPVKRQKIGKSAKRSKKV